MNVAEMIVLDFFSQKIGLKFLGGKPLKNQGQVSSWKPLKTTIFDAFTEEKKYLKNI